MHNNMEHDVTTPDSKKICMIYGKLGYSCKLFLYLKSVYD